MKKYYYRLTINTVNKPLAIWLWKNKPGIELQELASTTDIIYHTWSHIPIPKWLGKQMSKFLYKMWYKEFVYNDARWDRDFDGYNYKAESER